MTNVLSTLRKNTVILVRTTSRILKKFLSIFTDLKVGEGKETGFSEIDSIFTSSFSSKSSRSDSLCSCISCRDGVSLGSKGESRLLEGCSVSDFYEFTDILGRGSFSTVYLARKRSNSQESLSSFHAAKVIQKSSLADCESLIEREIEIHSSLDHPHIVHLEEVYEENNSFCLVMEVAEGGEVFGRLVETGVFSEGKAANILIQLLSALSYIHDKGIVHRDLKLENLLYVSDKESSQILVSDFGLSEYSWILRQQSSVSISGTPTYLAPEVIARRDCTIQSDMWSVGVIAYMLLVGYPPFYPESNDSDSVVLSKILEGSISFEEPSWSLISSQAKDFISKLLDYNMETRMSSQEALSHPWLSGRCDKWNICTSTTLVFLFALLYFYFLLCLFNIIEVEVE